MNKKILLLLAMVASAGVFAQGKPKAPENPAEEKPAMNEAPPLNWQDTEVDIVLRAYGDEIKKTVLKDPGTPSPKITLKAREGERLTHDEYLEAIEVVLEMNGIHLEPYGEKFVRAVPRAKARKLVGMAVYMSMEDARKSEPKDGTVISVRLSFENIGTEEAQKALEGFKSDSGLLQVFERTNSILVTDTWENIKRMDEILRSIDKGIDVKEKVFYRQIKFANVNDIKAVLEAIVQESQKEMEKNKTANAARNQSQSSPRFSQVGTPGSRLFNRNQPQQPQPTANESQITSLSDAERGMIRGKVLIIADERANKLVIVTEESNMDSFDKVIEELDIETTPDTVVKVYRLKYADAEEVSDMINDLIGNAPSSKSSSKGSQNASSKNSSGKSGQNTAKKAANQRSGEAKAGELSKDNTTVLADKRINGLVVMTEKGLVKTIESIIESMDVKLSQVLIETCIIEVTLGDDIATGVDWVNNHWTGKDPVVRGGGGGGTGATTLNSLLGGTSTKSYSDLAREAKSVLVNEGAYSGSTLSADQIAKYISDAQMYDAAISGVSPVGAGVNYFLKSDKLNISAVISASKSDSHSKYIASPIVMTVDNKEATIEATEARKFYSGSTTSSGYSNAAVSYNYSDKDLGIKIKVTPKINPNGTVMLNVEEEYSQLGAGQSVLVSSQSGAPSTENIDTALTRKMTADVLLENMQTVVLGGLTETSVMEKETGIPILKDIPWIGKWLFGSVVQSEGRKELLVFMTPYVLSDGDAAQVEAARRKRALSDQNAWDDHGWSASKLADPVSAKEQLRKQKAEWKKQDEEHAAEREMEKAKETRLQMLIERMEEEAEEAAKRKEEQGK